MCAYTQIVCDQKFVVLQHYPKSLLRNTSVRKSAKGYVGQSLQSQFCNIINEFCHQPVTGQGGVFCPVRFEKYYF